jgi:hypothetical protein
VESYDSSPELAKVVRVFKWQKEVETGYIEDYEDIEEVEEVKKVEVEVEEEGGGESLSIEEISSFDYRVVNVGQWEQEL